MSDVENLILQEKYKVLLKSSLKNQIKFIDALMEDKSRLNEYFHLIVNSFDSYTEFCDWYYDYLPIYYEWFRANFQNRSIQDILAMVPTITPWAFEGKCPERYMGELPSLFGKRTDFQKFCSKLISSPAFKAFAKVKDMEIKETLPEKHNYKKDLLAEKYKKVSALLKEKMGKDFSLKCGKTEFMIHPLFNPFSNKVVLRLTSSDKEKFILKISPYNNPHITTDESRKAHENQLIRADSPYSNACVDFYLKYNNCPAAAQILYYDFITDAVLYKESNCQAYHYPHHVKNYKNVLKFNTEILKCVSDLGLYLNDVRENNLLINKKSHSIELIDSGHMSYISPLNPGCPGYTYTLGNLCGRDTIGHFGVLMTWKK